MMIPCMQLLSKAGKTPCFTYSRFTHQVFRTTLPFGTVAAFDPTLPNLPGLNKPAKSETTIKTATFVKSSVSTGHMPAEVGPEFAFIGHSNVGKSTLLNFITGRSDLAKVSKQPGKTTCINHFLINHRYYLVDCPGYGHARASKTERVEWHAMTKAYFLERRTLAHVFLLVDSTLPPQRIDVDAALWLTEHQVPFSLVFTKVDLSSHGSGSSSSSSVASKRGGPAAAAHWRRQPAEQGGQSNLASIVPTFCNAVHHLAAQLELAGQTGRTMAACSRYCVALQSELKGPRRPPFYIPTSATSGLGREALLEYMAQLRQLYRMPIVWRK
ncbi:P-loop containing nucleoside triphosphate hydrolase protein [Dunaliella salina]|uniref:P-loop containing nucleoside triphosphate hydrolase protein n=1 Tax=Dunaliella salina TaxID=3046 RepID=A0ABQ7FZV0_DUNSA|nr:P-loop containing nucleoside triphosphate hydrolase protein [Dunaliella salina]|eukprot:KAF5827883.1 P-loop containing nucleoside triphosphate hydrolase protein [Dunaliella salina]